MEPKPEPVVVSKPVVVAPSIPVPDGEAPHAGGPVPVELQFVDVGDLHQGWFSQPEIATALSKGLGACMATHSVIKIAYDDAEHTGSIRLVVDTPKAFRCEVQGAESVDLSAFAPLGKALARYRDTVAGKFDYRVSSFAIEIEALSGTKLCELEFFGQFPPDGTTFRACANLGGDRQCVGPEKGPGVTVFPFADPAHTAYLKACFTP